MKSLGFSELKRPSKQSVDERRVKYGLIENPGVGNRRVAPHNQFHPKSLLFPVDIRKF